MAAFSFSGLPRNNDAISNEAMKIYSLFDLNEHIRQVLALNFQQPLWITAEITRAGQSRGHYYIELVQKGEGDNLLAQAQAVLWANDYRRLRQQLGAELDLVLRDGLEVKMQVRIDFHERYGLKLLIADIDPAFTFGQLNLRRRQTLQTLCELGLLDQNRRLPMPRVLQRVAVITSEGAAGFQDFREHLEKNAFGYRFHCELFASSVQGKNAETELIAALKQVAGRYHAFDCAVIVRGGGARLDLAAFDGLELCKTVARMPLPVLTGIGHEVDESVLDLTAFAALKTPTAVADFLLQHNLFFENEILGLGGQIRETGNYLLKISQLELGRMEAGVHWSSRERIVAADQKLDAITEKLPVLASQLLRSRFRQLEQAEAVCLALQPENVLRRGYSMTLKDGNVVTSPSDVAAGDMLETRLSGGTIVSRVEEI